jgi:hypothetical protein
VGCWAVVVGAWDSLGERETEPRLELKRLAKVSPAKEERRALRGGEDEGGTLLFSSAMVVL